VVALADVGPVVIAALPLIVLSAIGAMRPTEGFCVEPLGIEDWTFNAPTICANAKGTKTPKSGWDARTASRSQTRDDATICRRILLKRTQPHSCPSISESLTWRTTATIPGCNVDS
jgi:hypothetical protein